MNFLTKLKAKAKAWLEAKYSAGATKASSWWANLIALVGVGLPDLINWGLTHADLITGSFPTMSLERKFQFLLFMNGAAFLLRMWKQPSVQVAVLKQATKLRQLSSPRGTDAVVLNVPGAPVEIVEPIDSVPDDLKTDAQLDSDITSIITAGTEAATKQQERSA